MHIAQVNPEDFQNHTRQRTGMVLIEFSLIGRSILIIKCQSPSIQMYQFLIGNSFLNNYSTLGEFKIEINQMRDTRRLTIRSTCLCPNVKQKYLAPEENLTKNHFEMSKCKFVFLCIWGFGAYLSKKNVFFQVHKKCWANIVQIFSILHVFH